MVPESPQGYLEPRSLLGSLPPLPASLLNEPAVPPSSVAFVAAAPLDDWFEEEKATVASLTNSQAAVAAGIAALAAQSAARDAVNVSLVWVGLLVQAYRV